MTVHPAVPLLGTQRLLLPDPVLDLTLLHERILNGTINLQPQIVQEFIKNGYYGYVQIYTDASKI